MNEEMVTIRREDLNALVNWAAQFAPFATMLPIVQRIEAALAPKADENADGQ